MMNEIALVVNNLTSELGESVFYPEYSPEQDNCLLGFINLIPGKALRMEFSPSLRLW